MKKAELRDHEAENKLNRNGFVQFKNFLTPAEVKELFELYKKLHPVANADKGMWNSLYDISREEGLAASEKILSILKPKFEKLFVSYYTPVATFMSKNCNANSTCDLHRDFSLLDECEFQYRNIWIPLVSTRENNGALYVLPGSNQVFDYELPMFTEWPYRHMQAELFKNIETVEAEAGDLVIYLDKTLHGSHVNYSTDSRPVVHLGALHPDMDIRFYYHDRPANSVKVYSVPFQFFFEKDFGDQLGKYPLVKEFAFNPPVITLPQALAKLKQISLSESA